MKQFQFDINDVKKSDEVFWVTGRSTGNEPIALGDFLYGLEVVGIQAYGKELAECPPGLTAGIVLSFKHRPHNALQRDGFLASISDK